MLIDLDNSNTSDYLNQRDLLIQPLIKIVAEVIPRAVVHQIRIEYLEDLDKLCTPCTRSKSTRVVSQNKSMTATTNKLKEVYVDLWDLHDSLSQLKSIYAVILMCEYIRKIWTLYLRGKNDFINVFQVWLLYIKVESEYSMKLLWVDGGGKFISNKLRSFCEKQDIAIWYIALYIPEKNGLAKYGSSNEVREQLWQ